MAGFDIAAAAGLLSPIVDRQLHSILYSYDNAKLNPGFASMKRAKATAFGEAWEYSVEVGSMGSTSATYGTADTNKDTASPTVVKFKVTPSTIFTKGRVDGATLDRCNDMGGVVKALSYTVKSTLRSHMRKLCVLSSGTGSGSLGVMTAAPTAAPNTITVSRATARHLEKNDMLVAAAAEVSGGLRSATSLRITAIDRGTGVATLSGSPVALGWQSGDHIFWEGCRNLVFVGQFGWAPATAPSATLFFDVDRTADTTRLGGDRFNSSGKTYRKALLEAALQSSTNGANIDRVRMSIEDYTALCVETGGLGTAPVVLTTNQDQTTIGFKGITISGGPTGSFDAIPDESLPPGHAIMEDSSVWVSLSTDGDLARIEKADGLTFRKIPGAYAYEVEVISVLQPICLRPGHVTHIFNLGA